MKLTVLKNVDIRWTLLSANQVIITFSIRMFFISKNLYKHDSLRHYSSFTLISKKKRVPVLYTSFEMQFNIGVIC